MTVSQLALICAGFSLNALTFVLGVLVGVSLSRKDSTNDCNEGTEEGYWHLSEHQRTSGGASRCLARGARKGTKTNFAERSAG
jgi:hypothetical protein